MLGNNSPVLAGLVCLQNQNCALHFGIIAVFFLNGGLLRLVMVSSVQFQTLQGMQGLPLKTNAQLVSNVIGLNGPSNGL